MAETEQANTFKRLRSRYRLVVMNDDTYEEVITFKLSRSSVYIWLCTIFVLLVGFTIALFAFTPLKFYIPGYGERQSKTDLQVLKIRTDSLEQALKYKDTYLDNIKAILGGKSNAVRDTSAITIPKTDISSD